MQVKPALDSFTISILAKLRSRDAYYLGDPNFLEKAVYVPGGRSGDRLIAADVPPSSSPEEIILSLVGQVDTENFWGTPEGSWRPDSAFKEPIEKASIKMSFFAPTDSRFHLLAQDFPKYFANIDALHKRSAKPGDKRTLISPIKNGRLAVRHPLFSERVNPLADSHIPEQFDDFATWPVGEAWRDAMDSIQTTHDIEVLPAYDVHDNLIPPAEYAKQLPGATVELRFALIRFVISSKGESRLVAEVREINVLAPPVRVTIKGRSALKRKAHVLQCQTALVIDAPKRLKPADDKSKNGATVITPSHTDVAKAPASIDAITAPAVVEVKDAASDDADDDDHIPALIPATEVALPA